MSRYCENCGKTNNSFVADPLSLVDGKILCHKCAEPIAYNMDNLYYAESRTEYFRKGNAIIEKSKQLYSEAIVNDIAATIQKRSKEIRFPEDVQPVDSECDSGGIYKNVGAKIKGLANFVAWIGIICSVIAGIFVMCLDEDMILAGFLIIALGAFISWLSNILLYGYGQMIDNSDKLVEIGNKLLSNDKSK